MALASTLLSDREPIGDKVLISRRFAITNTGADDEWIAFDVKNIVAVLGYAVIGTAALASTPNFIKNAQGTDPAAPPGPGDLAVESAAAVTLEVTVLADV